MDDRACRELHDRATRGESRSAIERDKLNAWYAQNDAEEQALLRRHRETAVESREASIDAVISQIREVTDRLDELHHGNRVLKSEIEDLYRRLPHPAPARSA